MSAERSPAYLERLRYAVDHDLEHEDSTRRDEVAPLLRADLRALLTDHERLTRDNAELREAGNDVADDLERAFDTLDKWEVHHMIGGKALADWRALTGPSEEE